MHATRPILHIRERFPPGLIYIISLKMETLNSQTLKPIYQNTRWHIPEDCNIDLWFIFEWSPLVAPGLSLLSYIGSVPDPERLMRRACCSHKAVYRTYRGPWGSQFPALRNRTHWHHKWFDHMMSSDVYSVCFRLKQMSSAVWPSAESGWWVHPWNGNL
jgi:hypothetical protein